MISRKPPTCSRTPEPYCPEPQESHGRVSSSTTSRNSHKAPLSSKIFYCDSEDAVVKTWVNRDECYDASLGPETYACCKYSTPHRVFLHSVPGQSLSSERILDTSDASIGGDVGANTGGRRGKYFAPLEWENTRRGCGQKYDFYGVPNFTRDPHFNPDSGAVDEVPGCGTAITGTEERCGRGDGRGEEDERNGGGESSKRTSLSQDSCEKTCLKMWSLSSFHIKWRVCSIIFFALLTTAVSAHPLIGHPRHSATLISKPPIRPSNFTSYTSIPPTPESVSSAPADHANSTPYSAHQTSAQDLQSSSDGGQRLNSEHDDTEKRNGGSAAHERILDTAGEMPVGAETSVPDGWEIKSREPSATGNKIPSRDVESRKKNKDVEGSGSRHPNAIFVGERGGDWSGTGGPGAAHEDFDEAVRQPPTPQEAERISRFNASGFSWSLLTEAMSQLVQEVAQRRWSPNATWQLDNSTSSSDALRHHLTAHQLRQLREKGFSSVDFSALEAEISRGLPSTGGGGDRPVGGREGRSFSSRLPRFFMNLGRMLDLETVINEVETSIMTSVSCNACKGGVGLLQHYIEQGNTKEDIVRAASKLCTNFRVETPRVCFGILHLMADEVVYVMENLVMQPDGICGFLIGDVCGIPPDPYHKWRVLFPPYPKPPIQLIKPPKEDTPTYKVLHLSDTHYDPYYLEGSNAECNEPMCCRATSGVPASDKAKAGKWGDYRKCDTPKRTIVSMYEHIARVHPDVDYIIWTGDLPPHDIWNQTRESNLLVLRETVEQLKSFFPGVPVFPALGNHESAPVNSFPPPSIPPQHSVQWLYDDLMVQWLKWLPPHTAPTIQKGGYYSVLLSPGFRIISLNMNFCNNKNWWLLLDSEDPADQLQWLVYELQAAELKGEKVHILGHIPPGYHDCLKVWSRNFYTIVNRYEATISAQFYGHTHYDELEVFYDDDDVTRPTSVAYVGPSVTTYPDLNPGYRVYWVERGAREGAHRVVDHETWIMDLDTANDPRNAELDPHWYRLYSAREAYEMRSLLPVDWDNLVYRMVEDQQLFDTFYRHYWKNSPRRAPCDAECKKRLLCDLKSGRSNDRKKTCAVVHERVEAQERSQWRSWLYSGLTLTSLATLFVLL